MAGQLIVTRFAVKAFRRQEHFVLVLGLIIGIGGSILLFDTENGQGATVLTEPNNLFGNFTIAAGEPVTEIRCIACSSATKNVFGIVVELGGWAVGGQTCAFSNPRQIGARTQRIRHEREIDLVHRANATRRGQFCRFVDGSAC